MADVEHSRLGSNATSSPPQVAVLLAVAIFLQQV